jgi:hypothetical protein
MKRNRIVINLDEPAGARRRRGGRGIIKVLLVIAIVLLLVAGGIGAGGYFWWRNYQSSPGYSLALLVDGAQRNDGETVDKILDTEKITDDFVAQVRQRLPSLPGVPSSAGSEQLDSAKALATTQLRQTLHDQLIKEIRDLTDVAAGKPFVVVALAVPRFVEIKQQDKTASATAKLKDEQIQLTMQANGDRWRIVAVKDDKLAKLVADSLAGSALTTGTQVQDAIKRQLNKWNK